MAAAIASIMAATLENQGVPGVETLKALVFLAIVGTVVVSGSAAHPLAWFLDLRLPRRDRVAILSASGLALALAQELRAAEVPVIFLETDPRRSRVAEEKGFTVVFGDPLEDRTLLRARAELVGTAVGLTFSEHFSSLFVQQALDRFDVPCGYVAMESLFGEKTPSLVRQPQANVLFDGPHDHERWDSRWRHGQASVEHFVYLEVETTSTTDQQTQLDEPPESKSPGQQSQERYVVLTVTGGKHTIPMHVEYKLREGDVASIAIFNPERKEALTALANMGWRQTPSQNSTA